MTTSTDTRQLLTLLRISSELDIVGDVSVTVTGPSDLLAWARALPDPTICAWRADDSGHRYIHVTAPHHRNPIHGRVTAVLDGDAHPAFWTALLPEADLANGDEHTLPITSLVTAWSSTVP